MCRSSFPFEAQTSTGLTLVGTKVPALCRTLSCSDGRTTTERMLIGVSHLSFSPKQKTEKKSQRQLLSKMILKLYFLLSYLEMKNWIWKSEKFGYPWIWTRVWNRKRALRCRGVLEEGPALFQHKRKGSNLGISNNCEVIHFLIKPLCFPHDIQTAVISVEEHLQGHEKVHHRVKRHTEIRNTPKLFTF